jgi:hypothetical protein
MTITRNVQTLPRTVIQGYLYAARLPLTAVARAAHQQNNEHWPPALAYEKFEAGVETVLGSVLRDSTLVEKGRIRRAKIAQLLKADELTLVAEHERAAADQQAHDRLQQIATQRKETERRAARSKNDIERQAELHGQKLQDTAVKKASAARRTKATQDKTIDRRERAAKTTALTAESRALRVTKQALQAEEKADLIDETIEGSKAARKAD